MRVISFFLAAFAYAQPDALTSGVSQFQRGDYAAARQSLEKAPDGEETRTFLALTKAALGLCPEAVPELSVQFEKNSNADLRRLAGLAMAQCQAAQNQIAAAVQTTARLQALYPSDPDVLYQSAKVHMKAWNNAVFQMYQNAPSSFRVNQLSAEILEIQGKYTEAVAEYRKALAKSPSSLNLHFRLGRALLLQSHETAALADARKEFEAELALNPADAAAEFQVAQLLIAEQNNQEAAQRLERALSLNPDFAEAAVALARLRLQDKRPAEAIRLLEHAVEMQPRNESARYSLMLAYRNAGRATDALQQKTELDKLQKAPEGEFSDFLRRLGEKPKQP
ncbi:MAG: tetratricopeptide repeat protein [Bryobacteraceae bacterium]